MSTAAAPGPLTPPPALKPGDAISLVAPASSPNEMVYRQSVEFLEAAGHPTKVYRDVCKPHGYLAGLDDARVDEMNQALADPDTRAVLAVRGGYGVGRIVDRIDFGLLRQNPKIVCGYSDLTALHAAIQLRSGLISFHGPNLVAGLGDGAEECAVERDAFRRLATGQLSPGDSLLQEAGSKTLRAVHGGQATGRLVGGNLAVLLGLWGTPYQPDLTGAILLLEDTGEATYRVDRLLTQLRLAGALDRVAGVALGYFSDCGDEPQAMDHVLSELLKPIGVPVLAGVPSGHEHPNVPLPLGPDVELDADSLALRLAGPAVSESKA